MRLTRVTAASALLFMGLAAGCQAEPQTGASAPAFAPSVPTTPTATPNLTGAAEGFTIDLQKFSDWKNAFRVKALAAGISPKTFDAALGQVTPNAKIIASDQAQPESNRAIWDYLDSAVSAKRVVKGTALLTENAKTLKHIQLLYGISPRFVVAIWGMESNFGSNVGGYNVFEALATLAYEGRRATYAESELINALKIAERGDATPEEMMGSWAGAMGQTQFMPSAYLSYAVDDDGDGRRDLFQSIPDVLASTANFLAKSSWRAGETWGEEVKVPKGFDYSSADPTITLPMSRWRQLGIRTIKGVRVPGGVRQAALFLPAGYKGPAFLLQDNFKAILKYNNSTAYGLGVGLLADRIKGAAPVVTPWPRDERPLTADERREMQDLLNRLGYGVGAVDGILGAQTRLAIKSYQKKAGVPADGFASASLLELLRAEAPPPAAASTDEPAATPPAAPSGSH